MRALAFIIAMSLTSVAYAQPARILPDSVNIALIDGTTLHDPCEVANWPGDEPLPEFSPPDAQCVIGPGRRSLELQNAYVRELRQAGWDFEGGAANVFFFERPDQSPECRQKLYLIGLPRDAEDGNSDIIFAFARSPEPICGETE